MNHKYRRRKNPPFYEEKRQLKYGLKKLSGGVVSCMIGCVIFFGGAVAAHAEGEYNENTVGSDVNKVAETETTDDILVNVASTQAAPSNTESTHSDSSTEPVLADSATSQEQTSEEEITSTTSTSTEDIAETTNTDSGNETMTNSLLDSEKNTDSTVTSTSSDTEEASSVPTVADTSLPGAINFGNTTDSTITSTSSDTEEVSSVPAAADEEVYEASNFEEFKAVVEEINAKISDGTYTINLTGNINFGRAEYECEFTKNTVILGNGHTIDLGNPDKVTGGRATNNGLGIFDGATLSLGKKGNSLTKNRLKITCSDSPKTYALVRIGGGFVTSKVSKGILNMYDGVELTGGTNQSGSFGSAVNIENGEFNMYGGKIYGNTHRAPASMGGAVAGDGRYGKVIFNMYGGSIRCNETLLSVKSKYSPGPGLAYGGGVFLVNATFNMYGVSRIEQNIVKTTFDNVPNDGAYGGGVMLYGGKAVLSGGQISANESSFGGGIYTTSGSEIVIKDGFRIMRNSALQGGGLYNNGSSIVEDGAIIANNKAVMMGDDIAHDGKSLTLASAKNTNTLLSTDNSNHPITGWYLDNPRWKADDAKKIDVTAPLTGTTFLKAAYENTVVPPTIGDINNQTVVEGNAITAVTPEVTEGSTVTVEGLGNGLSFKDGTIQGTPSVTWNGAEETKDRMITVKAEKDGVTTQKTFIVTVQRDTDGDKTPDITDTDDDGDGIPDTEETKKGSNPKDPKSIPQVDLVASPTVGDINNQTVVEGNAITAVTPEVTEGSTVTVEGLGNGLSFKDGTIQGTPSVTWNGAEETKDRMITVKAEKDGVTTQKTFIVTVQRDTDGDKTPDITDTDDDGDGIPDTEETKKGSNPKDSKSISKDNSDADSTDTSNTRNNSNKTNNNGGSSSSLKPNNTGKIDAKQSDNSVNKLGNLPKTGDESQTGLYLYGGIVSLVASILLFLGIKKRGNEQD
ncbi:YSIRK-type signal peptide-containing protein [Enterococcus faecium]|uniref:Gram-positive cocci surface proteins LPxTG domain-containing protein n=1 Tax=Enterococcus faecium TaxID=1352 RepID=A0A242BGH1_ENTFC|nr:YSIRK-type signal peptide-containing protein [Enterococcus faecium]OTN94521.1 hypothetical protein A5810_000764 [Enterococcus faecium]